MKTDPSAVRLLASVVSDRSDVNHMEFRGEMAAAFYRKISRADPDDLPDWPTAYNRLAEVPCSPLEPVEKVPNRCEDCGMGMQIPDDAIARRADD